MSIVVFHVEQMGSSLEHKDQFRKAFSRSSSFHHRSLSLSPSYIYINWKSTPVKISYIEKLMQPPHFLLHWSQTVKTVKYAEGWSCWREGKQGGATSICVTNSDLSALVLIGCGVFSRVNQRPPSLARTTHSYTIPLTYRLAVVSRCVAVASGIESRSMQQWE